MLKNLAEKVWKRTPYKLRHIIARSIQNRFTVSVAAIITNDKEEVLVLDHYFRLKHTWGLPGGFINHSEQPIDGIKREIQEETLLELREIEFLRLRTIDKHVEILFRAKGFGEAKVNSGEIKEVGWFSLDNLPEMNPSQIELVKKVLGEKNG